MGGTLDILLFQYISKMNWIRRNIAGGVHTRVCVILGEHVVFMGHCKGDDRCVFTVWYVGRIFLHHPQMSKLISCHLSARSVIREYDAQINQHPINKVPCQQRFDVFFHVVSPFSSSSTFRTVETSLGPRWSWNLTWNHTPSYAIAVMSRKSRAQGVASRIGWNLGPPKMG